MVKMVKMVRRGRPRYFPVILTVTTEKLPCCVYHLGASLGASTNTHRALASALGNHGFSLGIEKMQAARRHRQPHAVARRDRCLGRPARPGDARGRDPGPEHDLATPLPHHP